MKHASLALLLLVVASAAAVSRSWATLPDGYEILYLSPHASPEVWTTAGELAELMERQFGTAPRIRRAPLWGGRGGIRIGPDPRHPAFDRNPLTDEVLIERSGNRLSIVGSDNTSTRFAVFSFAEHVLGWRLYQPGELGLELLDAVPAVPDVSGPDEILLLERAAYYSRNPSSMGQAPGAPDWRTWQGLRERFHYNHTLHKVLPPTEFDTHPEWFAKDDTGKPMRPPYYPKVHGYNDHPDLSHPEVRQWVIEATLQALDAASPFAAPSHPDPAARPTFPRVLQSPGALSVSISLGDSFVFGSFDAAYPWKPQDTFRRWPDWSNHVFAYSNAVAEGISAGYQSGKWNGLRRPELYIGALAYLNWENVPDFPLHPSIVPYLTFDRSQWHDPAAKADDLRTVAAWNETEAPFLGTWDYLFGYGFLIPRSMTGIVSESIPALHALGVRAYFSQIAAIWPYDGHTNWLLARLLWDVDSDPDALLDEYFREFYGPAAASMRAFFDHAEAIWMQQGGAGWWLRHWKDPWQAGLWDTADLARGDELLDAAATAALAAESAPAGLDPRRFARRVGQTRMVFELTLAFHAYQSLCWQLQAVDWTAAAAPALEDGVQLAADALAARSVFTRARDAVVRAVPLASRVSDLQWIFRYDSLGASMASMLENLRRQGGNNAAATRRIGELLAAWAASQGLDWHPGAEREWTQVLHDTDFSKADNPKIWHRQFMDSEDMAQEPTRDPAGFVARNVRRGHLYQLFPAQPGAFYLGQVDLETRQSLTGEVVIRIDFFDHSHKLLANSRRSRIAPVDQFGPLQEVRALMQAPSNAAYGRLFIRFYEMDPGSQALLHSAEVFQVSAPIP